MVGYISALLGIVIISVLCEIILPSGQTAKYIKSLLAVFVVYVLITPVITFLKSDFNLKKYLNFNSVQLNQTLLKDIYNKQIETKQTDLENLLAQAGYENVEIKIVYEIADDEIIIKKVKINIKNLVITSQNQNINKYQYIRQAVMSQLEVKEEDVIFE